MLDNPELRMECASVDFEGDAAAKLAERLSLAHGGARLDVDVQSVRVHADVLRLEQVLANLINNARRHTPADGVVRV